MTNSENEYVIPTKERPIFKALCSDFGYIESGIYKDWSIVSDKYNCIGLTFALNLTDAITALHKFIAEYPNINKKSKFEIFMCDGTTDKYGEHIQILAYSITFKKAKLFKIID